MVSAIKLVVVDRKGLGAELQSDDFAAAIDAVAAQVAAGVSDRLAAVEPAAAGTVEVQSYTTDRRAAAVDIKYVTAAALQAKYGILTAAAGDVGLDFQAY